MSLFYWNTSNTKYYVYNLTLLSEYGVFKKYIVDGFTVSTDTIRYYDIASIYRTYYTDIDGDETGDNTTSELAISVAQCWQASEYNGETYYYKEETKLVTISSYAGFIRYFDTSSISALGLQYEYDYVDSHFIAFSADYDVVDLYEADISFYTQSKTVYTYSYDDYDGETTYASVTYGDIDSTYYDEPLTITYADTATVSSEGIYGLFGKTTYEWNRICTVDEFIEDLDEDEAVYDSDFIDSISDKQWVLRFYETEFSSTSAGSAFTTTVYTFCSTIITDITILRLKFLCSDGVVYNLGCVSNKVNGSTDPAATVDGSSSNCAGVSWTTILSILLLVLLLIICAPILPYIAKFIVWVISLPFKLIREIYRAIKNKTDDHKRE